MDIFSKEKILDSLREYSRDDLRISHFIIGGMILAGIIINLCVPRGWEVWPFVLAAGILTYINEAVDRNGQGLPPFHVYALFVGAMVLWLVIVMMMSVVNPFVLLIGAGAVAYRAIQASQKQRERMRFIKTRLDQGRCVHCGEIYDPKSIYCESCGDEPNPDAAVLARVASIYRSPESMARARAILQRGVTKTSNQSREAALIARHHGGNKTPATNLPKAAKLGGSRTVSSKRK